LGAHISAIKTLSLVIWPRDLFTKEGDFGKIVDRKRERERKRGLTRQNSKLWKKVRAGKEWRRTIRNGRSRGEDVVRDNFLANVRMGGKDNTLFLFFSRTYGAGREGKNASRQE
jgi:hypothetical protein